MSCEFCVQIYTHHCCTSDAYVHIFTFGTRDNTLQHAATQFKTPQQNTATHCNILHQVNPEPSFGGGIVRLQHALQHATYCNTLQRTAAHYNLVGLPPHIKKSKKQIIWRNYHNLADPRMFRDQQSPVSKPYLWIPQFGGTITVGSATCFYATRWGFPHTEIGRSFPQAEKKGFGGTITIGSATGFYVRQGWCCLHAERKKERIWRNYHNFAGSHDV